MSDSTDEYLIEVDGQERENRAVRQFCATPPLLDDLLEALGVPARFHWVLLEVPHGLLVDGRTGDVDLIAGALSWKDSTAIQPLIDENRKARPDVPDHFHAYCAALQLAASGGLMWPPPMDYLVAIEAKCAYFDSRRQRLMSQKASRSKTRNLRVQIDELFEVAPFNRVALLDFIVNPPASGTDGQAWINAAGTALDSLQQMLPTLRSRLPPELPSGHFVMPWGAVVGGPESLRGTGGPIQLRPASPNPRLGEPAVQTRRTQMVTGLRQLLKEHEQPLLFPVVLPGRGSTDGPSSHSLHNGAARARSQ